MINILIIVFLSIFCVMAFLLLKKEMVIFRENIKKIKIVTSKKIISGPTIGDNASDFSLKSAEEKIVPLKKLLSKPTVLLVIDSNCKFCNLDVDQFTQAEQDYKKYNFVLILYKRIKDANLSNKVNSYNNKTILEADENFLEDYNIKLFPTFIVISKEGKVIAVPKIIDQIKYLNI